LDKEQHNDRRRSNTSARNSKGQTVGGEILKKIQEQARPLLLFTDFLKFLKLSCGSAKEGPLQKNQMEKPPAF
jgi:hypothetical protein